jgi:pimeloyl-ACP methyl ester carboxylesterase
MTSYVTTPRTMQAVTTDDGVEISLDVYAQNGHGQALIVCPGFFKSKETRTFQRLAQALNGSRDVVVMDFRGHGRSGGLYTFSAREEADLTAVLRWAQDRYQALGVLGFSLGAAIAINTLRQLSHKVQSLAAVSAPSAFEEIEFKFWTPEAIRRGVQGLEPGAGCRPGNVFLKKERPIDSVRALGAIPKLFLHGTRDVIVGVEHSRRLYEAAAGSRHLHIIEGGSHAEALFRDDPHGFTRLMLDWFDQTLPPLL